MNSISRNEIALLVSFYLFFSFIYHAVLWYIGDGEKSFDVSELFSLSSYWFMAGMQYLFYFIASVFIWFLGIKSFNNQGFFWQICVVALLIPVVAFFIRELRYELLDAMGKWHLYGQVAIWDWYIPSLFLMIQFGCFFAYQYFKEIQEKIKLESSLKMAVLSSELSAIKAQLNPHFLYNAFNTISASLPKGHEKTRGLIADLSDLFRYQLKASRTDLISLGEEIEFIKNYLALEKERFKERLQITYDIDIDLNNEMIPPMLLQPIIENSIRHGLSSKIDGGEVNIQIKKKGDKIKFTISDTGIGISDKDQIFDKGVGLSNTKLRLEKMYNSKLIVENNKPNGVIISFVL